MLRLLLNLLFPKPLSPDSRIDPWVGPVPARDFGSAPPRVVSVLSADDCERARHRQHGPIDRLLRHVPSPAAALGAFPHDADDAWATEATSGGVRADEGLWGSRSALHLDTHAAL